MKILLSAYSCRPGFGSEPGVGWNWATRLSECNEVHVLTRLSNRNDIEQVNYSAQYPNLHFHYYDNSFKYLIEKKYSVFFDVLYYNIWQKCVLKSAKTLHEKYTFDIVHHVTYNTFKTPGFLYLLGVPFVLGPLGGGQIYPYRFFKEMETLSNLIKESLRTCFVKYSLHKKSVKKAYQASAIVLFANTSTYNITERIKAKSKRLMLETAIDENYEFGFERDYSIVSDSIKILWVGNLCFFKGFALLLEAVKKVNIKCELHVIGDGPSLRRYRNNSRHLDKSNVIYHGRKAHKETLDFYRIMDLFVFTSLRDTSGNVVLEAMANSMPVIAINHNGIKDMLDDDCAVLIEPRNREYVVRMLVRSIEKLAYDVEFRKKIGNNGNLRLRKYYLWDQKVSDMNDIYREIVK